MPTRITPTVGRVVLFFSSIAQIEPLAATVAKVSPVEDQHLLNLGCLDHNGSPFNAVDIPLIQDGDVRPEGPHATWMQYQINQAAKAESPPEAPVEDPAEPESTEGNVTTAPDSLTKL